MSERALRWMLYLAIFNLVGLIVAVTVWPNQAIAIAAVDGLVTFAWFATVVRLETRA